MFTGIVEETGSVVAVETRADIVSVRVRAERVLSDLPQGGSLAVDGCCLTAVRREGDVLGAEQSGGRSTLRLLRVLEHAEVIARARALAEEAVRRDPALQVPGFADAVTQTNLLSGGEWGERS